ncbi:Ig-like domain-containing protein [Streptomyces sp. NPDC051940]|uniref:Ig-like domain-containing protein n=1 Tax=Streptomyces sp. NPDC051940 TaxID=3155675 RepID=UPI00343E4AD9
MFRIRLPRAVAGVAAALAAVLAGGVLAAPTASAAPIGTLSFSPATGADTTPIDMTTSGLCPETATNTIVSVRGSGFPDDYIVVGNTDLTAYPVQNGGMRIPLRLHMRGYADEVGFQTLQGRYDFTVTCRLAFGSTTFGEFTGSIWFTSNTAYQSTDPNAPAQDTTVSLQASPSGPVDAGTAVTLTATTGPAGTAGVVQFRDNGTAIGSPVAVSGNTASLATSSLGAGTHALTAEFQPSSSSFKPSTSAPVSLTVNAAPATPTTTALLVSPSGSSAQYGPVSMTATVTPSGAAGSVKFQDTVGGNTTVLGTVPVSGGSAAFSTSALGVGEHSLTAVFVPANAGAYLGSSAAPVAHTITPFAGVSVGQNITTTVEAGALAISVEDPNVTLPSPQLNSAGTLLTTGGAINAVTLTDTRAGNPGWSLSGQVGDFTDGGSHSINGQNLGWTPNVIDKAPGQTVTAGAAVAPAVGAAPGDGGSAGLKQSRSLATGTGLGTAHFGADLALNVPTSTVAGTYTATLTLTAI